VPVDWLSIQPDIQFHQNIIMKEITLNAATLISVTFLMISTKDWRDFSWYKEALSIKNEPKLDLPVRN
jgi:hypothetical protein